MTLADGIDSIIELLFGTPLGPLLLGGIIWFVTKVSSSMKESLDESVDKAKRVMDTERKELKQTWSDLEIDDLKAEALKRLEQRDEGSSLLQSTPVSSTHQSQMRKQTSTAVRSKKKSEWARAVVLKEVLDEPRAKRPWRPHSR
ncbi:hypothetical protein [Mechercharimyces sp. CAU 1602]|uniref:hypothetical protein n=1 Tax=Mechercharimyces sp. CAU 1602 TaxID=2973933 RepID=UPI0021616802|nr:hypothetical protein [Mechercharimyces sp. CAU 1602]MCS1350467.1 hypothetical protein [Mechercharimyces sp. CAU 1602]